MAEPAEHLLVWVTHPDATGAEELARALVREGLAACVNIQGRVTSVYRWQGREETGQETLLLIKTRAGRYAALESAIRASHPYDLPEIIATPITRGLPEYLAWIDETTHD